MSTGRTLVIPHVDLDMLEYQRIKLVELSLNTEAVRHMTGQQEIALEGVVSMLDAWSDNREEN